jgi:hypothetical protein
MTAGWHELGTQAAVSGLRSARATQLREAIEQNPEFRLIEERSTTLNGQPADALVVMCTCEGVPSKNRVGIQYQEPLAILVSANPRAVPRVRALRRAFPVTTHQNVVLEGEPLELCLYEQRSESVLRTWTPPAFLRRIQQWLTETAHGRLHQSGQPVEQLFFDSPHKLILPAGYLEQPKAIGTPLLLAEITARYAPTDTERKYPAYSVFLERQGTTRASTTDVAIRVETLLLPRSLTESSSASPPPSAAFTISCSPEAPRSSTNCAVTFESTSATVAIRSRLKRGRCCCCSLRFAVPRTAKSNGFKHARTGSI